MQIMRSSRAIARWGDCEQTVHRVMEEVGLRVKDLRYYKSQPWPDSNSLLFGFFCELEGDP